MGVGSSLPAPSFPLRREILVSVCLVWVVLATCFCWPTYPSLFWAQLRGAGGGGNRRPPALCPQLPMVGRHEV